MKGDKLTIKQEDFIKEYVKTKNATRSAMTVYNTSSIKTARSMGAENLAKPLIKKSIEQILSEAEYNVVDTIRSLKHIEANYQDKHIKPSDSIQSSKILLQLSGNIINKTQSVSLNYNIDTMNKVDLLKLKDKYDKLLKG